MAEERKKLYSGLLIFALPFILFFGFMGALVDTYIFRHPSVVVYSIPFVFVTLLIVAVLAFRPGFFGVHE